MRSGYPGVRCMASSRCKVVAASCARGRLPLFLALTAAGREGMRHFGRTAIVKLSALNCFLGKLAVRYDEGG